MADTATLEDAEMPCRTRPTTNQPKEGAKAQPSAPEARKSWHQSIICRMPRFRIQCPAQSIVRAQLMRWTWMVEPTASGSTPNCLEIFGMLGWYWSVQKKSMPVVKPKRTKTCKGSPSFCLPGFPGIGASSRKRAKQQRVRACEATAIQKRGPPSKPPSKPCSSDLRDTCKKLQLISSQASGPASILSGLAVQ